MNCKYCGGECIGCGARKRKLKTGDGAYKLVMVPRVRCKTCGRTFTEYVGEILTGVHFSKTIVNGDDETYEYPSERTKQR